MTKQETATFLYKKERGEIKPTGTEILEPSVLHLWSAFSYEFDYWIRISGFIPVSLVAHGDRSVEYDLDAFFIFELVSGYATVWESGRSDYYPGDASIDIVANREAAERSFQDWKDFKY